MVNTSYFKSYGNGLFLVFFTILVLVLVRNAFYAHPSADDFCFASKAISYGSWTDATLDWYRSWGGRYTASAIASIFSLYFDLTADFWLMCTALILFTLLSFVVFFTSLSYVAGTRRDWFMWALCSFCFYIAVNPAFAEVLYWMSGGVTYTGGYGALLVVLGLLIRLTFKPLSKVWVAVYMVLCGLLVIAVAGFNEVAALLQFVLIGAGVFATVARNHHRKYVWVFLFILALVGLVAAVAAPGNAVRATQFQGGSVWLLPFHALYQTTGALIGTVLVMILVTSNNYLLPLTKRLSTAMVAKLGLMSTKERVFSLAMIVVVYSAVYAPSYWAQGVAPPNRTQIIFYMLPLLLWIPWLGLMLSFDKTKKYIHVWLSSRRTSLSFLSVVTLVAIVAFLNIKNITLDALWRAEPYNQQLLLRYDAINRVKQTEKLDLVVSQLRDIPKSIYFGDILSDSSHWRNQCYKDYFGLNSIRIAD